MSRPAFTTAEKLTLVATLLGLIHHVDHVLRFDHSGWPFRAEVTPFTYSLLVYPVIAALLFARGRPLLRVGLAVLLFLFPTVAHIVIETPADQFNTWAHRPDVNLLDARSGALGIAAAVVTVLLSVVTFVDVLAYWREYRASAARRA